MAKRFLDKENTNIKIYPTRFIAGIGIGLSFSFVLYSFLYLSRESCRLLSIMPSDTMWVLSAEERSFYNLVFAFLSLIVGQSMCLWFWLDRPRSFFGGRGTKRSRMINDQRVLNWYFLSWYSRLAMVFGGIFMMTFHGGFYVFSFYPDYRFLFVLVLLVLFLQSWNTILLTFRKRGLRWMLVSMLGISLLALALSKVELINYQAIDENYRKQNVFLNYDLDLVESDFYEGLSRSRLFKSVYLVHKKGRSGPILIMDGKELAIPEFRQEILQWKSEQADYLMGLYACRLFIDRSIKMAFVDEVKAALSISGINRIAFAVVPKEREYDKRYYLNKVFLIRIPLYYGDNDSLAPSPPPPIFEESQHFDNVVEVINDEPAQFRLNEKKLNASELKEGFKAMIRKNSNYALQLKVDDAVTFEQYFAVLAALKFAVEELRLEYAQQKFQQDYDELDYEQRNKVEEKLPFRFYHWDAERVKMLQI
jgi:biopolymer transport protein ExbD